MVLGSVLGAAAAFSPGLVFIAFLLVCSTLLILRMVHVSQRRFLLTLFLTGFLVRASVSLALDLGSWRVEGALPFKRGAVQGWDLGVSDKTREYMRMGDSDYYSQRGYAIAQYAKGVREPVVLYRVQQYGWHGYAYGIGAFYYLFDFSPITVKWVNCLIGAWLGPSLFFLVRILFNSVIARWVGVSVAFFPSLILWSATNLKDPSLFLLTALLLLFFVKCQQAWGKSLASFILYGMGFMGVFWAHTTLRSVSLSLSLGGCLVVSQVFLFLKKRSIPLLVLAVALGVVALSRNLRPGLEFAFYRHSGFLGPGLSYEYLPEEFYATGTIPQGLVSEKLKLPSLILAVVRAVFHFLAEPLPWRMDNLFHLLAFPQMVGWFAALSFASLGMFSSLRWNLNRSLLLVTPLVLWTVMGALTGGNVGTTFRIRDMVTPFYGIFACAGFWALVYGPRGLAKGDPCPADEELKPIEAVGKPLYVEETLGRK